MNKNIVLTAIGTLLITVATQNALALDEPRSSKFDTRIKQTAYNRNDVVAVDGAVGIATHIEVGEGEYYKAHAFGDASAWEFANIDNHFFVKPIAEFGDTNLTIITNKRSYYFKLNYHADMTKNGIYALSFAYPDEVRKQNVERQQKAKIEREFKKAQDKRTYNIDYTMAGDIDIAPINIWDDGSFTYFKFQENVDMPSIFFAEMKGQEAIVNKTVDPKNNNIVIVHKLLNPTDKWIVRKDNKVMSIFKESNARNLNDNASGTITNSIRRETLK